MHEVLCCIKRFENPFFFKLFSPHASFLKFQLRIMTSVHQQLENRLIFLRLECAERWKTSGPPHLPTWTVFMSVEDSDRRSVLRKKASGARKKDVRRRCMQLVLDSLSRIQDPCSRCVLWSDVSLLDGVDVALFEPPPSEWFSTPCSVGVSQVKK